MIYQTSTRGDNSGIRSSIASERLYSSYTNRTQYPPRSLTQCLWRQVHGHTTRHLLSLTYNFTFSFFLELKDHSLALSLLSWNNYRKLAKPAKKRSIASSPRPPVTPFSRLHDLDHLMAWCKRIQLRSRTQYRCCSYYTNNDFNLTVNYRTRTQGLRVHACA